MVDALVVPVGDIHGSVGANQAVNRPEPAIIAEQEFAAVLGLEAGAVSLQGVPVDGVREWIGRDVDVIKLLGKRAAVVEDAATGDVAALEVLVGYVIEIAERVGVVQGTVLAEALD